MAAIDFSKLRQLTSKEIEDLINASPDEIVNGHLHHILKKLGKGEESTRILEIQKKLWHVHRIDPIMSSDIYTWAPMAGVHGKIPTNYVIDKLNKALRSGASTAEIKELLKELGEQASKGFKGLF